MKVEEHMRHEHNGRRNVMTKLEAAPSAEVQQQPSAIAAPSLSTSLEELSNSPVFSALPASPAPFPMRSETAADSPPSICGYSVNKSNDTRSHRSITSTTSSSLPNTNATTKQQMHVYVLMPPRPRYVQRAREIGKEDDMTRAVLSPAGLRPVPIGNDLQAVICITCKKAVSFDMVIRQNHPTREHGVALTKQERKDLTNWFTTSKDGFVLSAKDLLSNPSPDETPI